MSYVTHFDAIKRLVEVSSIRGKAKVTLSYDDFISIIRLMIADVEVNEAWYLGQYPDVAEAVRDGSVKSAKQHFLRSGYFEGRLASPVSVDEKWYLQQNPDVATSIAVGEVETAQGHFIKYGYVEGRRPFPASE